MSNELIKCKELDYVENVATTDNGIVKIKKGKRNGKIALMCERCFNLTYVDFYHKIELNHSIKDNVRFDYPKLSFECKCCGHINKSAIELDPNIAEAVSILNKKGYFTTFCCEGHGRKSLPYITFGYPCGNDYYLNGFEHKEFEFDYLPEYWKSESDYCANGTYLRLYVSKSVSKEKYLNSLNKWVNDLPEQERELEL